MKNIAKIASLSGLALSGCLASYQTTSHNIARAQSAATGETMSRNLQPAPVRWDTKPTTWLATDDLGRKVPVAPQVPAPRREKWVGIFYSPWLGESGEAGPFDNTKILAAHPNAMQNWDDPAWPPAAAHHWGESVFGYYRSNDEWVMRKHAQMLSDAGVDCVIFDVTNQLTYPRSYLALCKVWAQVRKEGGKTPQIVFLTPFWSPAQVVDTLYRDFYSKGTYEDLWFKWDGKPLIMANPNLLVQTSSTKVTRDAARVEEGATLTQTFTADAPFAQVGARVATYNETSSTATISLFKIADNGARVLAAQQKNAPLQDNQWAMLNPGKTLPPGRYALELSQSKGQVAWWSYSGDVYAGGAAGGSARGDRALRLLNADGSERVLADEESPEIKSIEPSVERAATELKSGATLGQTFRAGAPFSQVGTNIPTFAEKGSGVTLSLREGGPTGKLLAQQRFENVADGPEVLLELPAQQPAGTYYLEMSQPKNRVGWWGDSANVDPFGQAYLNGQPVAGDREVRIAYAATDLNTLKNFFTFRSPRPDYFGGPNDGKPGEWGWLDVSPQKVYPRPDGSGKIEQVTVGVAQNAVDGHLSVLSNPRSHGRSFHNGVEPPPSGQDFTGKNFQEQWDYALKVDPDFVFVTGWNEWIAGRFPQSFPMFGTGPVNFVDQFNHEYSRDIEPVVGGHTDDYYYQLVANVRRFKGARAPLPPEAPRTIKIDGNFGDWKSVASVYRDDRFDTMHRDHPEWGKNGNYVNTTGRNDFLEMKVARDAKYFYFYARCEKPIVGGVNAMQLALNLGAAKNWLGYDVLVNRVAPANFARATSVAIERSNGGWQWRKIGAASTRTKGREMELAIPRALLQMPAGAASFSFKWLDNVNAQADPLNLYRNGDTAPNGRFRYAYRLR